MQFYFHLTRAMLSRFALAITMKQQSMRIIAMAGVLAWAAAPGNAGAVEIKYVVQGIGSGQVNVTPFTNQPITFTIFAHTENVVTGPFYFGVNNDSIALEIGAASYTGFAGSSYDFPQPNLPSSAGFAFVQALVGDDWDSAQIDAYNLAFTTYDLKTEIGPLSIPSTSPPAPSPLHLFLNSSGGGISILTMSEVTFQAIVVPEPSALVLAAIGATALFALRRRSSRRPAASAARAGA
jgi:hypothetical protein